jgi:hypothetical protein
MQTAADACVAFNEYGPASADVVADDGFGGYVVWVQDIDGDLWMCDATGDGLIYANALVQGDLLEGGGLDFVDFGGSPAMRAAKICSDALGLSDDSVVVTADDGLGDYLVWMESSEGYLTLCDASSNGEIFAMESIDLPLNESEFAW